MNFEFVKSTIEYAKSLKFKHNTIAFSMTTNALLLEMYQDFLAKNDVHLLISLDGDERSNGYRVYHNGKPAFKKILSSVLLLRKKYPVYFQNRVNFNAVLHNKNSVSAIYNYFMTQFNKLPSIGELNTIGIKNSQIKTFWKTYRNVNESLSRSPEVKQIEEDMFIKLQSIQGLGIFFNTYCWHVFKNYNSLLFDTEDALRFPSGTCFPFSKKIFVTAKGKLLPCERIDFKFELGHVDTDGVDISLTQITEIYNNFFDRLEDQCESCFAIDSCSECLFHMDTEKEKLKCKEFMSSKSFTQHLHQNISSIEKKPWVYDAIMKEVIFD